MQKFLLIFLWLPATILTFISSIYLLKSYSQVKSGNQLLAKQVNELLPKNQYQFFAALPDVLDNFSQAIKTGDGRPLLVEKFLTKYDSPLVPYANFIVSESDKYGIDFRLISAIAMCESTLGKNIPPGSYNAWGYAIYTGKSSGIEFGGWGHAISTIAQYLKTRFYDQGLTTPEEIGPIYAPPSVFTGNSWANCVNRFMNEQI